MDITKLREIARKHNKPFKDVLMTKLDLLAIRHTLMYDRKQGRCQDDT